MVNKRTSAAGCGWATMHGTPALGAADVALYNKGNGDVPHTERGRSFANEKGWLDTFDIMYHSQLAPCVGL